MNEKIREIYNQILQRLALVDFDKIWKGFHQCKFALYTDEVVYFADTTIPKDSRFVGNTALLYNDEYIAIWNIQQTINDDLDMIASLMVHEMFHVFQNIEQEKRFPYDLKMLNYPETMENLSLKRYENQILCQAFCADDLEEKRKLLKEFMAVRKYRQTIIGDIILQEYCTETIEGIAEYAGSMALKQLSPEKYKEKTKAFVQYLTTINQDFFDIRRMLYYSGTLFCIALTEAGEQINHKIKGCEQTLFEMISKDIEVKAVLAAKKSDPELKKIVQQHNEEKEQTFADFLQQHTNKATGTFQICGYDPMNMVKLRNMLLCTHFLMLKRAEEKPMFLQGPLIAVLQEGTVDRVCEYIL